MRDMAFTRSKRSSSIVARCATMWSMIGPAIRRSTMLAAAERRSPAPAAPSRLQRSHEFVGCLEIADGERILEQCHDRGDQRCPPFRVLFNPE